MKKFATLFLFAIVVFGAVASSEAATNYEQRAINAARQAGCFNGTPKELHASVATTSACFFQGFITTVQVIWVPTVACPNPETNPCPRPLPVVISEVQFGCDDEVMSVLCY